ncbi:hypothetical protein FRC04_011480 [Tulasnella sp. 424]|nr:hypothetical protein FRC04_011480 [Tulasnella sp. 424]KAG8971691.1 hypothetical protein FRC05_010857 [Tulasnella sp. 425]
MLSEKLEGLDTSTPSRADSATLRSPSPVQDVEETPEEPEKAIAAVPPQDESKLVGGYNALLVALDQTIVATAIPRIASEFNALDEVTWIASAYFLTQCGLTLTYGKLLAAITTKWVYLFAVIVFEIGSAICGAAPNVEALIVGRAIAGLGAAGIFTSCLAILAVVTRLETRPVLFGLFGGVFAFSNVIGPLLGGAFTDHVSWRWCFYINLPLGAITIATIVFFIKPKHSNVEPAGFKETMRRIAGIDWIGSILSIGMITSILLPLQWGGVTKPWNDKTVIALFCVFAVLLAAFVGWEWYVGEEKAIMPLSMWANRAQIGCCLEAFFLMFIMLCAVYYLPLYYQSAQQHTATRSGIDILAFMCCIIFGGALSGAVIHLTGRPLPWLIFPPPIAALSCGLIFWKLQHAPSTGFLLGMQFLLGLGCGCALQNCIIAIQAEYSHKPELVPQSTALVNFTQFFGGTLGIAIAGTIFGNKLGTFIAVEAPGLSPEAITAVKQSVEMIKTLDPTVQAGVIAAYSKALGYVFIIGIPSGIFASFAGCLIPNFNIKKMGVQPTVHAV